MNENQNNTDIMITVEAVRKLKYVCLIEVLAECLGQVIANVSFLTACDDGFYRMCRLTLFSPEKMVEENMKHFTADILRTNARKVLYVVSIESKVSIRKNLYDQLVQGESLVSRRSLHVIDNGVNCYSYYRFTTDLPDSTSHPPRGRVASICIFTEKSFKIITAKESPYDCCRVYSGMLYGPRKYRHEFLINELVKQHNYGLLEKVNNALLISA